VQLVPPLLSHVIRSNSKIDGAWMSKTSSSVVTTWSPQVQKAAGSVAVPKPLGASLAMHQRDLVGGVAQDVVSV
jgi:hypothetical protein